MAIRNIVKEGDPILTISGSAIENSVPDAAES